MENELVIAEPMNTDMFFMSDIKMSAGVDQLFTAISAAQGAVKVAVKDTKNDFFRSTYADLESVWGVVREPMSSNGLSVIQIPTTDGDKAGVVTILTHASGQYISGKLLLLPCRKEKDGSLSVAKDPQAIGSCITYAKRYALAGFMGVATADDDGNAASGIEGNMTSKKEPRPNSQAQNVHSAGATETYTKAAQAPQKPAEPTATDKRQVLRDKITKHLTEDQLKDFVLAYFEKDDMRSLPRDPEVYIMPYEVLVEALPFEPDHEGKVLTMKEAADLTREAVAARQKLTK